MSNYGIVVGKFIFVICSISCVSYFATLPDLRTLQLLTADLKHPETRSPELPNARISWFGRDRVYIRWGWPSLNMTAEGRRDELGGISWMVQSGSDMITLDQWLAFRGEGSIVRSLVTPIVMNVFFLVSIVLLLIDIRNRALHRSLWSLNVVLLFVSWFKWGLFF